MADLAVDQGARGRRGGGGAARRAERTARRIEAPHVLIRAIPSFDILDVEALEIIEWNAETILEKVGVVFADNPSALARWREAGADMRDAMARIPRGLARTLCATPPGAVHAGCPRPGAVGRDRR